MTARVFIGISVYNLFLLSAIAKNAKDKKNILIRIHDPREGQRESKFEESFTSVKTLTVEWRFFTNFRRRNGIDRCLARLAKRESVSEVYIAQDLDARAQYIATFFDAKKYVVEDGVSSYLQSRVPWKVAARFLLYKLSLWARYRNAWGIGFFPADGYLALDRNVAFPRVQDRSLVQTLDVREVLPAGLSLASERGVASLSDERPRILLVTQPLREDGYATTSDEEKILRSFAIAVRRIGGAVIVRSHPRETEGDRARRIGYLVREQVEIIANPAHFEVVEELAATLGAIPVFGFWSTSLINIKRILPDARVVSAVRFVSRIPKHERSAFERMCHLAGISVLRKHDDIDSMLSE